MKGFFMQKNDELVLLIGGIQEIKDDEQKYTVTIEYDHYERALEIEVKKRTTVFFQNQKPSEYNDRKPILWADYARKMNMREGSTIAVLARPNKAGDKADGYLCRYSGLITFAADEKHERERNAVGGLVTWIKEDLDHKDNPRVKMGVYMGKNAHGNFLTATVRTSNEKLMERCKKALTPRMSENESKPIKKYAWFCCGDAYMVMNSDGEEFPILTCYDFTITGTKKN